jgi:transposase
MDVHVRNSYLHVLDDDGRRLRSGRCRNTLGDLAGFLGRFEDEPMQISLENTTNSRAIHRMLMAYRREAGLDLDAQVLDARKLRIIAESVSKCDRLDAAVIAELTRADLALPTCYLPDDEEFALREHLRARHDLVTLRTRTKNRVHSVLHRRGILAPVKGTLFTGSGRAFLEQIELDETGRIIVNRYLELLDRLSAAVDASTKELRELMRRPRWAKPAALLQTMPGIGLITSMTILAELGRIDRFKSRSAVANYVGLVPVLRSSNEKCYSGGITKRGSKHLRAVLIEAAWESARRVPRYGDLFSRVSGRRGSKVAVVAVARRMVEDAWVMLKRDEAFRFSQSVAG